MLLAAAEVQLPHEALSPLSLRKEICRSAAMVYILLKRKPLPRRASTPDVKQTLKPDLLEGANSFRLGFLPPRVWRRLDEARRVTPGERQKKGIEKTICVCTFVIAILHGSLCDGFVSSAVTSFQRCFFCNLYKASFGGLPSHCCELEQQLTVTMYNAT
jgi:hypothetical protein